ncbi:MAG: cation:proton antiporter, partial [Candidatus Nezhaarchaeales archaeon]
SVLMLTIFSDIAIALLAFEVGREVGLENIKRIGLIPIAIGLGEVVVSFTMATLVGLALRLECSIIVLLALISLSTSTAVTYKLLEERGLRDDKGRLIMTVSTVEDVIQIIALTLLPQFSRGRVDPRAAIESITLSIVIVTLLILVGITIVRHLFTRIVKPDEFGLTLSVCLSFAYAIISRRVGLSPALGAFVAGLALSAHPQANEISERMKPLKEVFLVTFFVTMGFNANIASTPLPLIATALVLCLPVIAIKFVAFLISTWLVSGYSFEDVAKMTFFAITISEFGLIVAYEATRLGFAPQQVMIVSAVSTILAMITSSILTKDPDKNARKLSRLVPMPIKLSIDNASKYLSNVFERRVGKVLYEMFMRVVKEGALMVFTAFIASSMLYVVEHFSEPPYSLALSIVIISLAITFMVIIAYRVYVHADELCFRLLCERNILKPEIKKLMKGLLLVTIMSLVALVAIVTSSQYLLFLFSRIMGSDLSYAITSLIIVAVLALIFLAILSRFKKLLTAFRSNRA